MRRTFITTCLASALLVAGCTAWQPLALDGVVTRMWHQDAVPPTAETPLVPEHWDILVQTTRGPVHLRVPLLTFAALREGEPVVLEGRASPGGERAVFDRLRHLPGEKLPAAMATNSGPKI